MSNITKNDTAADLRPSDFLPVWRQADHGEPGSLKFASGMQVHDPGNYGCTSFNGEFWMLAAHVSI